MIEKSASWPMAATQLSSPPPLLVCNHFFSSPSRLAWKIELDRSRTWWFYWAESPREFPVGEGGNVHPRHTQVCLGWVEPAQMPLPPLVFDASHPLAAPHIPGHPDVLRAPRFAFMLLRRPRGGWWRHIPWWRSTLHTRPRTLCPVDAQKLATQALALHVGITAYKGTGKAVTYSARAAQPSM